MSLLLFLIQYLHECFKKTTSTLVKTYLIRFKKKIGDKIPENLSKPINCTFESSNYK